MKNETFQTVKEGALIAASLSGAGSDASLARLIFARNPAITRTGKKRSESANRLGVLVFFPDGIRIRAAPPLGESHDVPRRILVDENPVRDVALMLSITREPGWRLRNPGRPKSDYPGFHCVSVPGFREATTPPAH
jgi:hypothetical protein